MTGVISRLAIFMFLIATGASYILILKMLDERRGKQLSAARLLLNPFLIARTELTERGQRYHTWFLRIYAIGFVCWVMAVVAMLARLPLP